jgi:hypothetical protein
MRTPVYIAHSLFIEGSHMTKIRPLVWNSPDIITSWNSPDKITGLEFARKNELGWNSPYIITGLELAR